MPPPPTRIRVSGEAGKPSLHLCLREFRLQFPVLSVGVRDDDGLTVLLLATGLVKCDFHRLFSVNALRQLWDLRRLLCVRDSHSGSRGHMHHGGWYGVGTLMKLGGAPMPSNAHWPAPWAQANTANTAHSFWSPPTFV